MAKAAEGTLEQPRRCDADGCKEPGFKFCSRCGRAAYCSAECQRKAWKDHKSTCLSTDDFPSQAQGIESEICQLLREGRLYSARESLKQLPKKSSKLEAALDEQLKLGIHSEVVNGAIRMVNLGGWRGRGYVAARPLRAGEPIFFDTAFVWAPLAGAKEPHFIMTEKMLKRLAGGSRRTSEKVDVKADFLHNTIKALPLKGNMLRSTLEDSALEDDVKEQMILCSVSEGCALYCTEEPNFVALYPAAAYFNHSCAPNAVFESNRVAVLIRVGDRPIAVGHEVLLSYLPPQLLENRTSCRARLDAGRGFLCRCQRCEAEGLIEIEVGLEVEAEEAREEAD